jgi:hypothetical protein
MRLTFALLVCLCATARADPEVLLSPRTPAHGGPSLQATVIGAGRFPSNAITIRDGASGVRIAATTVHGFADGDQPIAIAFVVNSQEVFMGAHEGDDTPPLVWPVIERGLDQLGIPKLGPSGSTFTVIHYDTGARIAVPETPLASFRGNRLGLAADFHGKIGTDLVAGIALALGELERSTAPHKLMIVIGDGNDTDNAAAHPMLLQLKQRARAGRIDLFAPIYKTEMSSPDAEIRTMISDAPVASAAEYIAPLVGTKLAKIANRLELTFTDDRLPWDGRDHDFTVQLGDRELDPITLAMPDLRPHVTGAWWHARWAQLVAGLGVVLLVGLGLRLRS